MRNAVLIACGLLACGLSACGPGESRLTIDAGDEPDGRAPDATAADAAVAPWTCSERLLVVHAFGDDPWLYAVSLVDGTEERISLEPTYSGAWSPDGRFIAYDTYDMFYGNGEAVAILTVGGDQVLLPAVPGLNRHVSWAPDSSRLAYRAGDSSRPHIVVTDRDASSFTEIPSFGGNYDELVFSPGGSKLLWTDIAGHVVWVSDGDGANPAAITPDTESYLSAGWSPDGQRIVASRYVDGTLRAELVTMNATGGDIEILTSPTTDDFLPVWSPDGSKIAFLSREDQTISTFVINPDGTGRRRLAVAGGPLVWSPDSTVVAARGKSAAVLLLHLESGLLLAVAQPAAHVPAPFESCP